MSPALTSSDSPVDILPNGDAPWHGSREPSPRGVGLSAIGRRRRRDGQAPLADGQGANHPRLFVPRHVAVVLVGAGRGIDDRLLGGPRRDVDAMPSSSMLKLCGVTPSLGSSLSRRYRLGWSVPPARSRCRSDTTSPLHPRLPQQRLAPRRRGGGGRVPGRFASGRVQRARQALPHPAGAAAASSETINVPTMPACLCPGTLQ